MTPYEEGFARSVAARPRAPQRKPVLASPRKTEPVQRAFTDVEWFEWAVSHALTADAVRETRLIGPEFATFLLSRNQGNRTLTKGRVRLYAARMSAGQWKLTPEAISVDISGNILNGQHRLTAVTQSGIHCPFILTFGWPRAIFSVIDVGGIRTEAQIAAMDGIPNASAAIALATLLHRGLNSQTQAREMRAYLGSLTGPVQDAIRAGGRTKAFVQPSIGGVAYYWIATHTEHLNRLEEFWDKLAHGERTRQRGCPVFAVRDDLLSRKAERRVLAGNLADVDLLLSAWNAFISKQTAGALPGRRPHTPGSFLPVL